MVRKMKGVDTQKAKKRAKHIASRIYEIYVTEGDTTKKAEEGIFHLQTLGIGLMRAILLLGGVPQGGLYWRSRG